MPTEHCPKCKPKEPCGNSHLYVIEFKKEIEKEFVSKSNKGYLYVGSTGKSVEDRFNDNFIKKNGHWKYNSPNTKKIRKYFFRFRPDLFYYEYNPIITNQKDKGQLERREGKLADKLRNRHWKVGGPSWKKNKKNSTK